MNGRDTTTGMPYSGWVKLPSGGYLNLATVIRIQRVGNTFSLICSNHAWEVLEGEDAAALSTFLDAEAIDLSKGSES